MYPCFACHQPASHLTECGGGALVCDECIRSGYHPFSSESDNPGVDALSIGKITIKMRESGGAQAAAAYDLFTVASAELNAVPEGWMLASDCRPLIQGDPAVLWLEWFGHQHGFTSSPTSEYSFAEFLFRKGRQLEAVWLNKYASDGVRVCTHDGQSRYADSLRQTNELMEAGTPVIIHPALWWAPERIYGVPDLIVLTTWLNELFPNVLPAVEIGAGATANRAGHYVAVDVKVKTKIDDPRSKDDLEIVKAQIGMYSYMLGHLQAYMPQSAFVICRDRVTSPFRIELKSVLNSHLDQPLASIRDHWRRPGPTL